MMSSHTDSFVASGSSPTAKPTALPQCPKTRKKSFLNEVEATAFEKRNREQYGLKLQYAYPCEDCTAWHLTSSPPGNSSIAQVNYQSFAAAGPKSTKEGPKGIDTTEVVRLRKSGKTLQQIADELKVSVTTVSYHLGKAEGTSPTKSNPQQLFTYEQYRDRRIALEAELATKKRQHQEIEATIQAEIDRVKQTEDRLFEARQLKVGYAPNGIVILSKNGGQLDLTAEDVKRLLAEVSSPTAGDVASTGGTK
jgi:AraC-like DNA-binding protein